MGNGEQWRAEGEEKERGRERERERERESHWISNTLTHCIVL